MSNVEILLDRIETDKNDSGQYLRRRVYYAVWRGTDHFEVPIEIGYDVAEDRIIAEARVKLHQFLQECVEALSQA